MEHKFHPALDPENYIMHDDPGHGWLEVPLEALRLLGISKLITSYSYRKDDKAYLEEDCDASLFIKTWKAYHEKLGVDTANIFKHIASDYSNHSPIRNYRHY